MLRTKSIQAPKEPADGLRISIMRKPHGEYDMWIPALAPSEALLNAYRENKINWDEYECKFLLEMHNNPDATKMIQFLINITKFAHVTLLCWEETIEKCHRRLIVELVHSVGKNNPITGSISKIKYDKF